MKLAALALIALALAPARCGAPEGAAVPAGNGYDISLPSQNQASCVKRGGTWGQGGLSGAMVCYEPTPDAGKSCRAGTDCSGLCLAKSQTCAPIKPLFGCNDILMDNGMRGTICVD